MIRFDSVRENVTIVFYYDKDVAVIPMKRQLITLVQHGLIGGSSVLNYQVLHQESDFSLESWDITTSQPKLRQGQQSIHCKIRR